MANNQHLGPLLRLWGLTADQLPPHTAADVDEVSVFMMALLQEAVSFVDSVDDYFSSGNQSHLWQRKKTKPYTGKDTGGPRDQRLNIDLIQRTVPVTTLETVLAQQAVQHGDGAAGGNPPGDNAAPEHDENNPNNSNNTNANANHGSRSPQPPKVQEEKWFCRRSTHINSAAPGTASWTEFLEYMKDRHAETEKDMTPTVMEAHEAIRWPAAQQALRYEDGAGVEEGGRRWSDFTLALYEMKHQIPVFHDRVFPVLQMSCRSVGEAALPEFLIVSVTVRDFGNTPATKDLARITRQRGLQAASYVSVERIRIVQQDPPAPAAGAQEDPAAAAVAGPAAAGDPQARIEWIMATASDAEGVIPQWMQRLEVPDQIAKDVPLFLSWIAKKRQAGGPAAPAPAPPAPATGSGPEQATPAASTGGAAVPEQPEEPPKEAAAALAEKPAPAAGEGEAAHTPGEVAPVPAQA